MNEDYIPVKEKEFIMMAGSLYTRTQELARAALDMAAPVAWMEPIFMVKGVAPWVL